MVSISDSKYRLDSRTKHNEDVHIFQYKSRHLNCSIDLMSNELEQVRNRRWSHLANRDCDLDQARMSH